ncbi:hypothetical protein OnM2_054049 [Erysiphe neolycopersici]|uniref:Uncharacterized protein n=1 Tax=Erysiphe neolycopersici TaxID=212602 RepID=A0A420HRN4_9PEZI|nr:hypothetical protein OnM2_054049 [Erysiphe neolycopersici]
MASEKEDADLSAQEQVKNNQEVKLKVLKELPTISEVVDAESTVSSPTSNVEMAESRSEYEKESNVDDFTEEDITLELPDFDWDDFENRYTEGLQLLDKEETQVLDQFDQLMEMFFLWAQTGSTHETDRAVKRLKTRERYVQLSEASLEQKKAHCKSTPRTVHNRSR